MIPGKVDISQIKNYFKSKKIHSFYQKIIGNNIKFILNSVEITQTYLNQFIVNDKLAVFALCSPTSSGNILIHLWAPIQQICDQKRSHFFFKKYLDYLEQHTTFKGIVYKGEILPQLEKQNFLKDKQKYYKRKRSKPITRQPLQFQQFFSLQFTNMMFNQQNNQALFYSDQITAFDNQNSWCNPFLIQASNDKLLSTLQFELNKNIKSLSEANKILQDDEFDNFQIDQKNKQMVKGQILLCKNFVHGIPKNGFVSNQGFMILLGNVLHLQQENVIVKTEMLNNINLYFGSGFDSVKQMILILQKIKRNSKQFPSTKLAFKMFSKQVYGRYFPNEQQIKKNNLKNNLACYGNWDMNFAWRDQLHGKIIHPLKNIKHIFGKQKQDFYCVLQIKDKLICGILIQQQDFLY